MSLAVLKESLPDFAKDIKLNLEAVLTEQGASGLTAAQIQGIALASAYAARNKSVIEAVRAEASELAPAAREAARAAVAIMAMNNVYYRFVHLADDKEFSKMPARLRMNVIAKPGIAKEDFELMALAVSALNGCGMCVNAHVAQLNHAGVPKEGIQSAVRIAAVVNAAAQAADISN